MGTGRREAAPLGAQRETLGPRAAGRRDDVDRAAERRTAVAQAVRALVDLDVVDRDRVDLLELREPARPRDRHAIAQHRDPAPLERRVHARAANRDAALALGRDVGEHARREGERIAEALDVEIPIGGLVDEADRSGNALHPSPGLVDRRRSRRAPSALHDQLLDARRFAVARRVLRGAPDSEPSLLFRTRAFPARVARARVAPAPVTGTRAAVPLRCSGSGPGRGPRSGHGVRLGFEAARPALTQSVRPRGLRLGGGEE